MIAFLCYKELFGNIGALKRARLIKEGTAEAVFINKADALEAVNRYHMRELDGKIFSKFFLKVLFIKKFCFLNF